MDEITMHLDALQAVRTEYKYYREQNKLELLKDAEERDSLRSQLAAVKERLRHFGVW
jgi:hypothetical protein